MQDQLLKRQSFSDLFLRLQNEESLRKIEEIKRFTDETYRDSLIFVYGGNMWRKNIYENVSLDTIEQFTDEQKSAILPGNYDMVCIVNEDDYNTTAIDAYKKKVKELTDIFKKSLQNTEFKHFFTISMGALKKDYKGTISYGRQFWIQLEYKPRPGKKVPEEVKLIGRQKLLYYLELGYNQTNNILINPEYAYTYMVDQHTKELTVIGQIMLIFMMSDYGIRERNKSKGLNVDEIRLELTKQYLIPITETFLFNQPNLRGGVKFSLKPNTKTAQRRSTLKKYTNKKKTSMIKNKTSLSKSRKTLRTAQKFTLVHSEKYGLYTVSYIVFILFPRIFNLQNPYYQNMHIQGQLLNKLLELYNTKYINDIRNNFESKLLDLNGGGTPGLENEMSIRQLIMLWVTHLSLLLKRDNDLNNRYGLMLSGGDVFRAYIKDITTTSDIDTKFFFKGSYISYKNPMIMSFFIATLINMYLYLKNYFRMKTQLYTVNMKGHNNKIYEFVRIIDTTRQEIISDARILSHFIVPLVSVDLKLKGKILYPNIIFSPTIYDRNGIVFNGGYISVDYLASPLDISMIKTNEIPHIENFCHTFGDYIKKTKLRNIEDCKGPNYISIPKQNGTLFCTPPYPNKEYILEDLETIIAQNQRPHKKEKDISRLGQIRALENQKYPDLTRVFEIQHISCKDLNEEFIEKYRNTEENIYRFLASTLPYMSFTTKTNSKTNLSECIQQGIYFVQSLINPNINLQEDPSRIFIKIIESANLLNKIVHYRSPHSVANILKKENDENDNIIDINENENEDIGESMMEESDMMEETNIGKYNMIEESDMMEIDED
jgi:hypothetical protein